MSNFADVPTLTPEERRAYEQGYRRGYRDGWMLAMDAFYDRIPTLGRDGAYEALWDFWIDAIRGWAAQDCTQMILPPRIPSHPRQKGRT